MGHQCKNHDNRNHVNKRVRNASSRSVVTVWISGEFYQMQVSFLLERRALRAVEMLTRMGFIKAQQVKGQFRISIEQATSLGKVLIAILQAEPDDRIVQYGHGMTGIS
jgi:hypothetical protein